MIELASLSLFVIAILLLSAEGFSFFGTKSTSSTSPNTATNSSPPTTVSNQPSEFIYQSRRDLLASLVAAGVGGAAVLSSPAPALAAADCMKDCLKNCLLIAPKVSSTYREKAYCLQKSEFLRIFLYFSFALLCYVRFFIQQDKEYCTDSCISYCAQDDRTDGLSGSVSAENGEVGILGGSFGQGTVPKGEDKVSFFRCRESALAVSSIHRFWSRDSSFLTMVSTSCASSNNHNQPPSIKIPGLDFSSESGKKLLGY